MLKYRNNISKPSFGSERNSQLDANLPHKTQGNGLRLPTKSVETSQANKSKVFQHIHKIANLSINYVVW